MAVYRTSFISKIPSFSYLLPGTKAETQNHKTMKNFRLYFLGLIALLSVSLTGCEIIGDIFRAGMWTAVIIIILIVLIIGWLISKFRR
jgi:predicted Na+-dependent transporter